eukprot:scaffold8226_cov114-Isochrysis_galbana.AAC.5
MMVSRLVRLNLSYGHAISKMGVAPDSRAAATNSGAASPNAASVVSGRSSCSTTARSSPFCILFRGRPSFQRVRSDAPGRTICSVCQEGSSERSIVRMPPL